MSALKLFSGHHTDKCFPNCLTSLPANPTKPVSSPSGPQAINQTETVMHKMQAQGHIAHERMGSQQPRLSGMGLCDGQHRPVVHSLPHACTHCLPQQQVQLHLGCRHQPRLWR